MLLRARMLLAFALAALVTLSASQPQSPVPWQAVADGVEHAHITRQLAEGGVPAGLWNINALRLDPTRVRLDVVRAMDAGVGLETVSSMAQRYGAVAAVNGGYFRTTGTYRGESAGTLRLDGTLLSEPDRARSAVGLVRSGATTRLIFGNVTWRATLAANGSKRTVDGINRPRGNDDLVIFTPQFHRTTLTDASGVEAIVRADRVVEVRDQAGSSAIPADGFVISARGGSREWVQRTLRAGVRVQFTHALIPADPSPANPWTTAEDVLGGGPTIVTNGKVNVTDKRESMIPNFATDLHPRTAIGSLADGRLLLVVVDGRQPAISDGMSLDQLARLLIELGAADAMNLDGGGSSTMVVQGKIVNHPSDLTGERPVSDAIVVLPRR